MLTMAAFNGWNDAISVSFLCLIFLFRTVLTPILDIHTEDVECGRRITLSAKEGLPKSEERLSTWIIATDKETKRSLRCEVFLGNVDKISIFTTTKNLATEDTSLIGVQGFDKEGNLFSSLEGLPFNWHITSNNTADQIIDIIPFRDQFIDVSDVIIKLESAGFRSSVVLIKASRIGKATITAKLRDPIYSNVNEGSVNLSVLEPLHLVPGNTVYMAPFSKFVYSIHTFKRDAFQPVPIPSPVYKWTSSNPASVTIDNSGAVVLKKEGTSTIRVEHTSMKDNFAVGQVKIVEPYSISLHVVDKESQNASVSRKVLSAGNTYFIYIHVYDKDMNKIYQTNDLRFKVTLESELFNVLSQSSNQDTFEVVPTKAGTSEISVVLESVGNPSLGTHKLTRAVSTVDKLTIINPLRILGAKQLSFPYSENPHVFQFESTGGSGVHKWMSSNTSVASVNNFGLLVTGHQGSSTIKCQDRISLDSSDSVDIRVVDPDRLVVSKVGEVEIDREVVIGISLYSNDKLMANCTNLNFNWNIPIQNIIDLIGPIPCSEGLKNSCACFNFRVKKEGQSRLTATLDYVSENGQFTKLSHSTNVVAFKPFRITPPIISLTYGSSIDLMISDGPQPWVHSQLLPKLSLSAPEKVRIVDTTPNNQPGLWRYKVTCLAYGEQNITVSIGNEQPNSNYKFSTYVIPYSCQEAAALLFVPKIKKSDSFSPNIVTNDHVPPMCSYNIESEEEIESIDFDSIPSQYRLRRNRLVSVYVKLFDENGKRIHDFSSLTFKWTSSDERLLTFLEKDGSKSSSTMKISDREGTVKVSVRISGYQSEVNELPRSSYVYPPTSVSHEFEVIISDNIRLVPSKIVMYNNKTNIAHLSTIGGSGFNHLSISDPSLARIEYAPSKKEISVAPLKTGIAKITAHDVCNGGSEPSQAVVYISDVHAVKTRARDMVRIGEQVTLAVEVSDIHENIFDPSQLQYMDFRLHLEGDSLEITSYNLSDTKSLRNQIIPSSRYIITGKSVGMSTVSISVYNPLTGKLITSTPIQIHVYPHLKIHPRKVELIPGASFHLTTSGGPPFRYSLTFSTVEDNIIHVEPHGDVTAKNIGKATVSALSTVRGFSHIQMEQNEQVLAGQDMIDVEVKHLKGILIHSSTTRLIQGEELVVRVMGADMESPFSWGGVHVDITWEASNPEILSLSSIYSGSNTKLDEDKGFSIVVKAQSPGKARITAVVTSGPTHMIGMSATISFEVILPLSILSDSNAHHKSELFITPGSRYDIQSNIPADYSLLEDEVKSVVFLDLKAKQVISKGVAGTSVVMVKEKRDQQTSLFKVNVKPPHHMELRPRETVFTEIPVGSTLDYDIVIKDELGRPFDSYEGLSFGIVLNTHDIINANILKSNESDYKQIVRIKAIRPGNVILQTKVITINPSLVKSTNSANYFHNLEDFQLIRVKNAIEPVNPIVHIGGTVKFTTTFTPKVMNKRIWYSGDSDVATVDPLTGDAVCVSPGIVNIYHDSSAFSLTTIKCTKIHSIVTEECVKSSVLMNETSTIIPLCEMALKFRDADLKEIVDSPNVNQNIAGHCVPKDLLLHAKFTRVGYKYYCEVSTEHKRYISQDVLLQLGSLTVDVSDVTRSYVVRKTSAIIIKEDFTIRGKKEVFLTPYKLSDVLEVKSSVPLSIRIKDPSLISLYEVSSDPVTEITKYEIRAKIRHHPFTTIITFQSVKSERTEEVLVIFREIGDDLAIPDEEFQGYQVLWITIGVAALSIFATYIYTTFSHRDVVPVRRKEPKSLSTYEIASSPLLRSARK